MLLRGREGELAERVKIVSLGSTVKTKHWFRALVGFSGRISGWGSNKIYGTGDNGSQSDSLKASHWSINIIAVL